MITIGNSLLLASYSKIAFSHGKLRCFEYYSDIWKQHEIRHQIMCESKTKDKENFRSLCGPPTRATKLQVKNESHLSVKKQKYVILLRI